MQQIRDMAEENADEDTMDALVAKLERVVKNWDYVAQPIQVSFSSRGLSHGLSHEVAREIRELAVELYNEHRLLEVSKRLTEIQQEVFAEIAKITEQLDDDDARLDEITEERTEIIEEMKGTSRVVGAGDHLRGGRRCHAEQASDLARRRALEGDNDRTGGDYASQVERDQEFGQRNPDRNHIPHHRRLREILRPDRAEEAGDLQRVRRQTLENSRCAAPHGNTSRA